VASGYRVVQGRAVYEGRTLAEWVPQLVGEVVEAAHPERVILFGSVGRGDDGPDSDIDLMVVLPHLDYAQRRQLNAELRSRVDASVPVELFLTDERECRLRRDVIGSLHYHPLREGRLVYERPADN
jgi:predicted nucleotidyltransferase